MLQRTNAVCFLAGWVDACALWRFFMPHLSLPGSSFFCFQSKFNFNVVTGNDVCVVQRCCTRQQFEFIKTAASLGMKIIYDCDDDVWDLPDFNPAQKILTAHKDGFNACIRFCDVVTVSTRTLAKVLRRNVKFMVNARTGREIPIVVVENRIQEGIFAPPSPPSGLVVGWGGSSSHIGDLALVDRACLVAMEENPLVVVEWRGGAPPADCLTAKHARYRHVYWTPVAEFAARMPVWRWSIALAPCTDHSFNESKSAIKMVEAAYCKIPCLASWIRPYEEFCMHDPELKWLLCAGAGNFERKLRDLVNDEAMRQHYGERAYRVVIEHYSYRQPHEGWLKAIEMVRAI